MGARSELVWAGWWVREGRQQEGMLGSNYEGNHLVSGCRKKFPSALWLKTKMYSLTVGDEKSETMVSTGSVPSGGSGKESAPAGLGS